MVVGVKKKMEESMFEGGQLEGEMEGKTRAERQMRTIFRKKIQKEKGVKGQS